MKRVSVALGLLAGLLALPAHADKYCEQTENFKQADEANCRLAIEGNDLLDDGSHGVRGGVPPCKILISGDGRQFTATVGKLTVTVGGAPSLGLPFEGSWNRGHGKRMYSLGRVKEVKDADPNAFHFANRHLDFVLSQYRICINSSDTIQDLIDRWKNSGESIFALELHKRGCTLNPKDDTWTCTFK